MKNLIENRLGLFILFLGVVLISGCGKCDDDCDKALFEDLMNELVIEYFNDDDFLFSEVEIGEFLIEKQDVDDDNLDERFYYSTVADVEPVCAKDPEPNNKECFWVDWDKDGKWDRKYDVKADGSLGAQYSDLDDDCFFETKWDDANGNGKVDAGERTTIDPPVKITGPRPK